MKKLIHVLDKDKRKRKRVELFSNLPVRIEALGRSIVAKIKDVSYAGIGVIIPPNQGFPAMESLEASVELPNQLFEGKIANTIILPNQEVKIGLFLPSDINREIDFNTTDSSWDRVSDPETVRSIFSDLVFKGPEAVIELKQNFSIANIIPNQITDSGSLMCDVLEFNQGNFERGKAKCTFYLFQTCHAFEAHIEKIDSKKIELKLSNTIARLLRRETVRIQKKNAEFELKIRLMNKDLETTIEEYEVFDYSEHGISLLDPDGELGLPRNLRFEEAIIEIKGVGIILGSAEIRSYQWNRSINSYIVGLKFEPSHEPHLTNWHNMIFKARYPSLSFEYKPIDHKKIWSLFLTSGYLGHLDNESSAFDEIMEETQKTWEKLEKSGVKNSRRLLLKAENKEDILGHLQIDKYYNETWCVHHLAISKESSKLIAKDFYCAITDILSSQSANYLITFHRPDLSWNQKNYYDFIEDYPFKEHHHMELFKLYDVLPNQEKNTDIRISKATKYDLLKIYKHISLKYPEHVLEALNYYPDDIKLSTYSQKSDDLLRGREFYVLKQDEEIIAFTQVEWGEPSINIFKLFDAIFLYNLGCENKEGLQALINASMDYLMTMGRKKALMFVNDAVSVDFNCENIKYLCKEYRWIANCVATRRYQAFSNNLYGKILMRRFKKKSA
jgi:hypothetical protein